MHYKCNVTLLAPDIFGSMFLINWIGLGKSKKGFTYVPVSAFPTGAANFPATPAPMLYIGIQEGVLGSTSQYMVTASSSVYQYYVGL